MAQTQHGGPYCGRIGPLIGFIVVAALTQYIGAGLIGLNTGATLVTALILGAIVVHIICTLKLDRMRRTMGS
ncbi:hypothetical protein [Thiohalorhabdus sp.]|uniref:hypothetical protein n=1 Tax=Thiohalorhabdus sp. TaxID=3094134 RepID=UPI002FC31698